MRAGTFVNFNVNLQQLKDNADIHQWLASALSPQSLNIKAQQSAGGGIGLSQAAHD